MKRQILTLSAFLGLMGLAAISVCSDDAKKIAREKPVVPSMIMTPEVPKTVSFCGKLVDLTRYNMHEGIDRELASFSYLHATTMLALKRANQYFPIIEPILKANGIPDDFKYLAVIESHLDPRIQSPAKAVGMWQLLESTGREYGLTITSTVDERCHVAKSTEAACRYLKKAYSKYGDWTSVAASYNAGMGRISRELDRQQVDRSMDLWLVEETTRYMYRILAMKLIFENPYKYGFVIRARDLYKPLVSHPVTVQGDIADLAAFARQHDVTYADLKRFNPWLRDRKLLTGGRTFTLQIPDLQQLSYEQPNTFVHNKNWIAQ